jgi:hypothetical protein
MSIRLDPNKLYLVLDPDDTKRWCKGMSTDPQFTHLSAYIGEPPELLAGRLYMKFMLNPDELKPILPKILKKSYYK